MSAGIRSTRAFTLIEILLAATAAAVILAAIYGIFSKAVHLRDQAMARTREASARLRAGDMIRRDLRDGIISGGLLATSLEGSIQPQGSSFRGYLKFTTTAVHDLGDGSPADLQTVEYFIVSDPDSEDPKAGQLMRATDRELLAPVPTAPEGEALLPGVRSLTVSFFDGDSWQDSWTVTEDDQTLPEAVRVSIETSNARGEAEQPIDVIVPWTTQVGIEPVVTADATGGAA